MEKTKLGISAALLGAIVWFACYLGGYVAAFLVVGYVLIAEKDVWLKKLSVKAIVLMFLFSVISAALYLLPNFISCMDSMVNIFGGSLYIGLLSNFTNMLSTNLDFIEKIVFMLFGVLAIFHVSVPVPVLEGYVNKCFGQETAKKAEQPVEPTEEKAE